MIRRNVELEARLIDDLLDVTRILQDKLRLQLAEADAHDLIRRAVEICRGEIDEKKLRARDRTSRPADHHVQADGARLQQVFWNLIKNAVKFTPAGRDADDPDPRRGRARRRPRLVVEFADTGLGIEPEVLGRIFDPFQQGDGRRPAGSAGSASGWRSAGGSSRRTAAPSRPRARAAAAASTFRVELDALPGPPGRRRRAGRRPAARGPRRRRPWRSSWSRTSPRRSPSSRGSSAALGHRVATAGTLAEAIEAASAGEFDLIVSDIGLPDGSGLDLPGRLGGRPPTPAIAVSGFGMKEDIRRSREAGFAAHLTKPIGFKELEATIRQVLA